MKDEGIDGLSRLSVNNPFHSADGSLPMRSIMPQASPFQVLGDYPFQLLSSGVLKSAQSTKDLTKQPVEISSEQALMKEKEIILTQFTHFNLQIQWLTLPTN